ncbi:MAG: hypothetical protein ACOC9O_01845 [Myxococcota bacterium]
MPGTSQGKNKRVKRERFLPHAHVRMGLQLEVTGCEADGTAEPDAIDRERHLVAMDGPPWKALTLDIELRIGEDVLGRTLPPGDRPHGAAAWVLVRCEDTRLRHAVSLGVPSPRALPLCGRVRLERDAVHGVVELRPVLVRSEVGSAAEPGYANAPGMRLAGGRSWEVRVDQARPTQGKFLEVAYHSFREDPQLAPYAGSVHRLECDGDTPRLWINKDHPKITAIMDDRGSTGPRARMRDVFFDLVSHTVWTQLFVRAATHLDESGEAVHEWETSVLQQLLPVVYSRLRTHPQRVARLRRDLAEGEWTRLLQQLDAALQAKHEVARHMTRLIEETVEAGR